ncbi:hypothetical protein C8039_16150 [Halogeometricum sp. wsp3]|nr:hypothetical protein C8039_16150 [Halogeometricum sp. wsp3]
MRPSGQPDHCDSNSEVTLGVPYSLVDEVADELRDAVDRGVLVLLDRHGPSTHVNRPVVCLVRCSPVEQSRRPTASGGIVTSPS